MTGTSTSSPPHLLISRVCSLQHMIPRRAEWSVKGYSITPMQTYIMLDTTSILKIPECKHPSHLPSNSWANSSPHLLSRFHGSSTPAAETPPQHSAPSLGPVPPHGPIASPPLQQPPSSSSARSPLPTSRRCPAATASPPPPPPGPHLCGSKPRISRPRTGSPPERLCRGASGTRSRVPGRGLGRGGRRGREG